MSNQENIYQLFIGKVSEIIGFEKTVSLLNESREAFKGIETNNGWIRIESEADLPKETGQYWAIVNADFGIDILNYWSGARKFEDIETENRVFVTHYQPIQKPKKPIF